MDIFFIFIFKRQPEYAVLSPEKGGVMLFILKGSSIGHNRIADPVLFLIHCHTSMSQKLLPVQIEKGNDVKYGLRS